MSCDIDNVVELARAGPLDALTRTATVAHMASCSRCLRRFEQERELSAVLRESDDDQADREAIPLPLIHAFRREEAIRRQRLWQRRIRVAGLVAAAIVLVIAGTTWVNRGLEQPKSVIMPEVLPVDAFVSLVATDPITHGEMYVFRIRMPSGALPLVGVNATVESPLDYVLADVLVSGDGIAREVVMVPPAFDVRSQRSSINGR